MSAAVQPLACPVCGAGAEPERGFGPAPLGRCSSCHFVFLAADDAVAELYDDRYFEGYAGGDYRDREPQRRHESRVRLAWMASHGAGPGDLLEVGAAAGFFLDEARGLGYRTVGVELNGSMAAHARDDLGLDVRTGRIEDAELPAASFDAVCAWHVIEHLPDAPGALGHLTAALRPGGLLFLEVPNIASALARRQGGEWPALDLPHHVGHHGPRSMRILLEGAGLAVVALDTIPFSAYEGGRLPRLRRVAQTGLESARSRSLLPPGPHPSRHQLLRAAARRP